MNFRMDFRGRALSPGLAAAMGMLFLGWTGTAAELCVNPGDKACYAKIGDAVAAAKNYDVIRVAKGTYKEDVTIGKPLSLIGAGAAGTVIDAASLPTGVFVDGQNNPGLNSVLIAGFTVEHANFEGILVLSASDVTIAGNRIVDNNESLDPKTLTCPKLPAYETNEGFDCGEGIHLLASNHSVVAYNLVEKNAGGILISDDVGPAHDNLILGNTVRENPFDCGITLASHSPAGVYHNTVAHNASIHNGFQVPGAGAGVGIFSPAPVTKASANVVIGNVLADNGIPGVAMHTHAPGATLEDNLIADNRLSGNGADTEDNATNGTAGINVSGPASAIKGTLVVANTISDEDVDLAVNSDALVNAKLNAFLGKKTGVDNQNSGRVDATFNWWGCAKGPESEGCTDVKGTVLFAPWLEHRFPPANPANGRAGEALEKSPQN